MRMTIIMLSAAAILGLGVTSVASELDDVLAKHVEAKGGMDKLKALQTLEMIGKSHMGGLEVPFRALQMRPNKLRIESVIQGQTMVQAFNGESGWYINPMAGTEEPQEIPEQALPQVRVQSDFDGFLIDSKEKGYTVEYVGEADVEGTPAVQLRVMDTADLKIDVYLDAEYFVDLKWEVRTEREGNRIQVDLLFSDYKDVDGLLLPHSMTTVLGGRTMSQISVDSILLNTDIDPAVFEMPQKEEEPKDSIE